MHKSLDAAGTTGTSTGTLSNDPYFYLSEEQQETLLHEARGDAAGLVIDTLHDFDKWSFVGATGRMQLFDLKQEAMDRAMVPDALLPQDPSQDNARHSMMHTILGVTRVRAKLDDFMRIVAADKRENFQNLVACIHEDGIEYADVFTAFGSLDINGPSANDDVPPHMMRMSTAVLNQQRKPVDMEQFCIKYYSLKAPADLSATKQRNYKAPFSRSRGSTSSRKTSTGLSDAEDGALTFCIGEYATIRNGQMRSGQHLGNNLGSSGRSDRQSSRSNAGDDHRVGIVAFHSLEDPQVTRYCKPIASGSGAGFAVTQRTLAHFSGIVAYPVDDEQDSMLEVVVKLSCFDPQRGISKARKRAMLSYVSAFQNLENALLVMRLRESPYLTSSNWVNGRKSCTLCHTSFTPLRRKHHCRLCGQCTCSKCSAVHQIRLAKAGKLPFRICAQCVRGQDDTTAGSARDSEEEDQLQQLQELEKQQIKQDEDPLAHSGGSPSTTKPRQTPPRLVLEFTGDEEFDIDAARGISSSSSASSHNSGRPTEERTLSSGASDFSDSRGSHEIGRGDGSGVLTMSALRATAPYEHSLGSSLVMMVAARTSSMDSSDMSSSVASSVPIMDRSRSSTLASEMPPSPSSASPASPSAIMESDEFYKRFSELSLMDFHDSEYHLSLEDLINGTGSGRSNDASDLNDNMLNTAPLDAITDDEDEEDELNDKSDIYDLDLNDLDDDDDDERYDFDDSEAGDSEVDTADLDEFGFLEDDYVEEYDDDAVQTLATRNHGQVVGGGGGGLGGSGGQGAMLVAIDQLRYSRLHEYGIMDSPREHAFDGIVQRGAQFLDCSLASISFVDSEREFLKAAYGMLHGDLRNIPRQHSLAAAVVRRCEQDFLPMYLSLDTQKDPNLATNIFCYESPHLRFVVGVPIKSKDGIVLGAIIMADERPRRELSPMQREYLRDLASQVDALMDDRLTRRIETQQQQLVAQASQLQMREQLSNMLSKSYQTGLQVQKTELQLNSSLGPKAASKSRPLHTLLPSNVPYGHTSSSSSSLQAAQYRHQQQQYQGIEL